MGSRDRLLLGKLRLQITKGQRAKNVKVCSSILSSHFQLILTDDLPLGIKLKEVFCDDDLLHSPIPHRWMGWGSYKTSLHLEGFAFQADLARFLSFFRPLLHLECFVQSDIG